MKDYFDDEEYDDLFNDENNDSKNKKSFDNLDDFNEDDFKDLIEKLKRVREEQLIMENYNNIIRQGVDVEGIAEYGEDNLNRLKQTLNIMIEFFEDKEDYEKCHDVKLFSDKINMIEF
tara:strand:+ start:599 stop:952 length:354 start_codon:yes stop_codon:yes gene_type:complete